MKVSMLAVAAFALPLLMVGCTLGWTIAGQSGKTRSGMGAVSEGAPSVRSETPPPAAQPRVPLDDVFGKDISGLPRYPGSARVHYAREDLGNVTWTEVEYVTIAEVDPVRENYRHIFRTEGWCVGDVGFSNGAWSFFITQHEREVYLEIEPRGEIVEVDFELTEPKPKASKTEHEDESDGCDSRPENQKPASQQRASARQRAPSRPPAKTPTLKPATAAYDYDDGYGEDGFGGGRA